jgi:hypothetical protein
MQRPASYEHAAWRHVIRVCYCETEPGYNQHGLRGIGMCLRWKQSFDNFLEDMGHAPTGAKLVRKDKDLSFCKENCIWGGGINE